MENKLAELRLDAKELKNVIETVQRPKVKDILTLDLRKIQTEIIHIEDSLKASSSSSGGGGIVPNSTAGKAYDVQIKNYSWEESDKFVKIYITNLKNVQSLTGTGDVLCEFTKNSLHLRLNNLGGKNHIFNIKETSHEFDAEKSHYKLKTDMVILYLAKTSSTKWEKLTMVEKKAAEEKAEKLKVGSKNNEGLESSIMDMMKNMYDQGDDEMKKTIMKSIYEGKMNKSFEP